MPITVQQTVNVQKNTTRERTIIGSVSYRNQYWVYRG